MIVWFSLIFFFSSRRRHTRCGRDWSSDVCSSDLRYGTGHRAWQCWVGSAGWWPRPGGAAGGVRRCPAIPPVRLLSGACRADVDLPADAVPVGDCAENVAPELLSQLSPDDTAVGQAVEYGPQPRLVRADNGQFDPGLRVQGSVAAVAGPQGDVAAGEQRVDHLVLLRFAGGRVDIAPPGDGRLATEHLLIEGDGLVGVAGEEQVGIERD